MGLTQSVALSGIRRIGVFGGAFDPPHNAHRALAQTAMTELQLDTLKVFPTGHAWHKARTLSLGEHRLAMARLAFSDIPGVEVDVRELERSGPTYTIDTLRELRTEFPAAQLFLLLGADQAAAFKTWRSWEEILQSAIICIAGRGQITAASGLFDASDFPGGRFESLQMPPLNISATDIRNRVAAHLGIDHLVPAGVARYIEQHHLYLAAR